MIDSPASIVINSILSPLHEALVTHGGLAQLGERLHGMQEVSGSIPLISTKLYLGS
jgi:hypothetical protein